MKKQLRYGLFPESYYNYEKAKIAIVPVPYDETSTWIKGADKGPEALLTASAKMELYDIETDSEIYKKGIFTDSPVKERSSPEKMVGYVRKRVGSHINKNKFVVLIGGEHSVSIGSIQAHAESYKDMCVLQLDAHADLRDRYYNSKFNHGCVMARAKEICSVVQAGIRSMDISERSAISNIFFAEDIYNNDKWAESLIKKLSKNVYVTIDLDVFDPSIMPSTGTPEPGGLLWYDILSLLKKVSEEKNVVGFDVVELCPNKDNKAPDFLAAKLIYKMLSYKFEL